MNFKEYLDNKTNLKELSKEKYIRALVKIEKEHNIKNIDFISKEEILELYEEVKRTSYNTVGNNMYSAALKHYIRYKFSIKI